ncbi:MAG: hypothetical protein FJ118_20745 [Deltaproteobacteria bacterium]|nr:hypothetical protein [Deltaproteobacteria bacterium]
MQREDSLVPISDQGRRVLDLVRKDPKQASQLMAALSEEERVSLVSYEASRDPRRAQDLLFLLDDDKSQRVVDNLGDRSLFRIMKAQSSTHIGVLSLVDPGRMQSILDLDQELFSAKGVTDPQIAYHWMVSFLEEDEEHFGELLRSLDIKVVASAFQDRIVKPGAPAANHPEEEDARTFPADFLVKLDRGELKPDDLEVTDEEARDILTRIHIVNEAYFNELISLMVREEDLKIRTAEEAFDRIHSQVGDMSEAVEEAEDMFVPLEE